MPEGPEIRRAADQLAKAVVGQPLVRAQFHFPALKPHEATLPGRRIRAIEPHGKALLTHFDHGLTLYSHNQLYGVWKVAKAGERPENGRSLRVVLETAKKAILLYSASDVQMWRTDELARHPFLSRLGPDVLDIADVGHLAGDGFSRASARQAGCPGCPGSDRDPDPRQSGPAKCTADAARVG
jgi:endonuclease-8